MDRRTRLVASTDQLVLATRDSHVEQIIVTADLDDIPSLWLRPGQSLHSSSKARPTLTFRESTDGLQVSSNNTIGDLRLVASPERRAIWNDGTVEDLGNISLHSVQTVGRVQILAGNRVRSGPIEVDGLDITAADARGEEQRPHAYGVYLYRALLRFGTRRLTGTSLSRLTSTMSRLGASALPSWEAASSWAAQATMAGVSMCGDSKPNRSTWMGGFLQGRRISSRAAFSSSTAQTSTASRIVDPS